MTEIDNMQNKLSKKSINFTKKKYNYIFNLFLFYLILGFYFTVNCRMTMTMFLYATKINSFLHY